MSRSNFCASATVDEPQAGDGATLVIGAQNNSSENPIPYDPRYGEACSFSLLIKNKWRLFFVKVYERLWSADSRQQRRTVFKSNLDDAFEIFRRKRPNGRLRSPGNLPLRIQNTQLYQSVGRLERYGVREIEIAVRLDQRQIHALGGRIGNDALDLGYREIAPRIRNLGWFIIDNPIVDAGLDAAQILTWELIFF